MKQVLTAACIALAAISTAAIAQNKAPIKVGVLIGLTGPSAAYTADQRRAIEAVTERVNKSGGVQGRPIELVFRDTKGNPTEAARVASQVVLDDKVVAVIGGSTASETFAFADFVARNEVPMLPLTSTQSVIDPAKPYYKWAFRMAPPLTADVTKLLQKVKSDGVKKVGIFFTEEAYGQLGHELMSQQLKAAGIEVVESVSAPVSTTDLTVHATKLRNARPDAVLIAVSAPNTSSTLIRKLREVGAKQPLYGVSALVVNAVLEAAGPAAEGLVALTVVNPNEPGPLQPAFDLLKDHGGVKSYGSIVAATAMDGLVQALRTGADTGPKIRTALETMGPIKGYAAGPIKYSPDDHNGWGGDTLFFVRVVDGKFKNF